MATDTVPAAVPGPPDPPGHSATTGQDQKGFLASMVAPVEPARPTFSLAPNTDATSHAADADGALDRSAPGVSSATFRDTTAQATKDNDPAGTRHKRSIWKEMWLAAATRWAKGGGTANKRLDLAKARAQANQVKETRTTSVTKSGGLPVRNSGGSGAGVNKGTKNSGGGTSGKGPANASGNRSNGAGRSGSGGSGGGSGRGGRGSGGGSGSSRPSAGGRGGKDTGTSGKGSSGTHRSNTGTGPSSGKGSAGSDKTSSKRTDKPAPARKDSGKQPASTAGSGTGNGAGKPGSSGKNGKDGTSGKPGAGSDTKSTSGKTDLTKTPKNSNGKDNKHAPGGTSKADGRQQPALEKTPLQKSRETGHSDGTKARRIVDHVKAYTDGARDGWDDEKTRNAKEHDRLDKAHTAHQPKADRPAGVIVTEKGDDGVTTDVKPLTVKTIDANTLTLGTGSTRTSVGRRELRNFKQYERKLEAKTDTLQKIAEACVQLSAEADDEAKDCQHLVEQAKGVAGGEKLGTALSRLAEAAKNQATEASELSQRARKAAEMCKVVLTNIQTRYAPLYKAVVDSDETKPAELRFYNDKGSYAAAA